MIFGKKPAFDWLIAGLGNPGLQYEKTRHNAGFMAADKIAAKYGAQLNKRKFDAEFGDCEIGGSRVLIVKPQTFMNDSGRAVAGVAGFYKIPADRIIIMFDDISLDVGKIRMRRKGSHGGHNGIKDIIEVMGTDGLMRVKIGVGERPRHDYDLKDWVLGRFPDDCLPELEKALDKTCGAVFEIITKGIDSAMNKYNS